jgi:hypothetical protein
MVKKCVKKRLFEQAKEIEIQAEPQTIMPMVDEVARELCSHNFYYEARGAPTQEGTFVRYNVLVMETGKVGAMAKRLIGAFTLQSLGSNNNRTTLTWLPRSRWGNGNLLTPMERTILAYSGHEYDEYFCQFIKSLDDKLTHYGLKVTLPKQIWKWIKSHKTLSIIGTVLIIVVTLLGTNWATVVDNFMKFLQFFR